MSIFKRGRVYWYKFMWQGKLVRESTKQGNDKVARQMEAAHRTSLAKGLVGIRERKPVSTLAEFCEKRFEPWVKATFEKPARKTWLWYRFGTNALKSYKKLATKKLDAQLGTNRRPVLHRSSLPMDGRSARLTAPYGHCAGCCARLWNGEKCPRHRRSSSYREKIIANESSH